MKKDQKTSWEPVSKWYGKIVGDEGHYFHQKIIMPGILRLFSLKSTDSVLDLACGQGVLAGQLPQNDYLGIDIAPSLIKMASAKDKNRKHGYMVADITKSLKLEKQFTHAAIVLALQNLEHPELVLKNARKHLVKDGKLAIVLNHPCFRIPRQSSWQIDEPKNCNLEDLIAITLR